MTRKPKRAPSKPKDTDIKNGFSLWFWKRDLEIDDESFIGVAAIDTANTPVLNASEARKAGEWLTQFADWSDHQARKGKK